MRRTFAGGIDTLARSGDELALRLCAAVEIDPGETLTISVQGDGNGAVVRWEGVKRLSLEAISRVLANEDDGEPFPARCTYVSQTTGQRCTRDEHADDPHAFPPDPAPYHGET